MQIKIITESPNGPLIEYSDEDTADDVELAAGDSWRVDWDTAAVTLDNGRRRSPLAASLAALIERDDEVDWVFGCDGYWADGGRHRPSAVEAALREWIETGDWDRSHTLWIRAYAKPRDPASGKPCDDTHRRVDITVTLHPEAPDCTKGQEHDWQSPHEIVGGCIENPGVFGHGGGVTIHEVCAHCCAHRNTDTWAQDPNTGEQGLTSVRYERADARDDEGY